MANRILDVVVLDYRLDPVETELRIFVKVEDLTPSTEIRGRLLGPRCIYASTIEIAYPLREVGRSDHVELRVLIPEPSWWDPESPFLYEGAVELWQHGVAQDRAEIRHGIRRLQITSKGLRLNGKPFTLRGKIVEQAISEGAVKKLRADGFNTLLTTVSDSSVALWNTADRVGFFVLGTANHLVRFVESRNELTGHPSVFGWIFNRADFLAGPTQETERPMFYGVNTSAPNNLANADFLCCLENELAWHDGVDRPKVVVSKQFPDPLPTRGDVIGWIEST